jgi:membrane protein
MDELMKIINKDTTKHPGTAADKPRQIPPSGWKDVLMRVKDNFSNDYLDVVSAGVGFYFFLALFPLIAAVIAIYGLMFDIDQVQQHIDQLAAVLPQDAHSLIGDGMQNIAQRSEQGLGWALIISIAVSLWSANQGTKALFDGVNIAYTERIERGFIKNNIISLLMTLGGIIVGLIAALLVVAFPALVGTFGLPDVLTDTISWLRWPLLFFMVMFALGVVYKFAPDRDNPQFKWVSWGAAFATVLWISGSLLFSLYVENFGDFDATYGSVAAVIILMLWFQLTSLCVLLGAEINAELEHQTKKDTTVGEPEPMGKRNAFHADHVVGDGSIGSSVIGKSENEEKSQEQEKKEEIENRKKDRERLKREDYIKKPSKETQNKNPDFKRRDK